MAGAETVYTFVSRGTLFLERGRGSVSKMVVQRSNANVAPTAAGSSYQLLTSTGTVLAEPAVTVVGDVAQVTLEDSHLPATLGLGAGYHERWTLVLDGVARPKRREVVLGRFELHPPMDQSEITTEYPDLLTDFRGFGTNFQSQMDSAWSEVTREIVRQGDFPDIYVESSDVYDWYKQVCLEKILRLLAKSQSNNERWAELWRHHLGLLAAAKTAVRFLPDRDRDGLPDSLARESGVKSTHTNVPPRRLLRRDPRWG
jgi:hypothetical protein